MLRKRGVIAQEIIKDGFNEQNKNKKSQKETLSQFRNTLQ